MADNTNPGAANQPAPVTEGAAPRWSLPKDKTSRWAEHFEDFVIWSLPFPGTAKLTKQQKETILGWVRTEIALGRRPSPDELIQVADAVQSREEGSAAQQLDWATNVADRIDPSGTDMFGFSRVVRALILEFMQTEALEQTRK